MREWWWVVLCITPALILAVVSETCNQKVDGPPIDWSQYTPLL
jgi:hypothetical protein